jgi:putative hydrolase of HD superfamily
MAMAEIQKLKILNRLKSVYRGNSVDRRKESAAEHTWSALMLADYYSAKVSQSLNKLRVYELLMYHDVVEILAGDTPLDPNNELEDQSIKELKAAETLRGELPDSLQDKFWTLFTEFEEERTIEARFARAIDTLDAIIQELDYKQDWVGWSPEFLVSRKEKYFKEFPELLKEFHQLVEYMVAEGYFSQIKS